MKLPNQVSMCAPIFIVCGVMLAVASSIRANVIFEDDFNDGVIDPGKWVWSPDGNGGTVTEASGWQTMDSSAGGANSPYKQLRTSVDLMRNNMTVEFRIQPAYVAGNKNVGVWLGEVPDNPVPDLNGFYVHWNSTANSIRIGHVTGAYWGSGKMEHTADWSVDSPTGTGMYGDWQYVKIDKQGDVYSFYRHEDSETAPYNLLGSYTDEGDGPSELYWA